MRRQTNAAGPGVGRGGATAFGEDLSAHLNAARATTSTVDILTARLEGVKERGPGSWIARCPAHEDRSPSLSIRETRDGTLLVHCFASCAPADVLAAVGLELKDLFPEPLEHHRAPRRDRRHYAVARDALKLLSAEADVVLIAVDNIINGITLSAEDIDRLRLAADRIRQAKGVVA